MTTKVRSLSVGGIRVAVVRKAIKNLHLGVYPPAGRVRVAAPLSISDNAVRVAVVGKLSWIRRQQAAFARQPRQSRREMVSGETHYFLGRPHRLRVVETLGPSQVRRRNNRIIELLVRPDTDSASREMTLQKWYRDQLRQLVPALLEKWETVLGVRVAQWGIKRMKTKWGSCNSGARRVWVNLDLATKPPECLDFIVLHELVHLIEVRHNDRFVALMNHHMPTWRQRRKVLNAAPLSHASWDYC
jgi:predicted metal-dependent hydrolase